MTYVAGFLIPVPDENREAYVATARKAWEIFRDYGALQVMEAWSEHVPEGRWTDFRRAVDLKPGETVCFSWMIWPDKASYEACGASVETEPSISPASPGCTQVSTNCRCAMRSSVSRAAPSRCFSIHSRRWPSRSSLRRSGPGHGRRVRSSASCTPTVSSPSS